jgi:hypothetical protein
VPALGFAEDRIVGSVLRAAGFGLANAGYTVHCPQLAG